MGEGLLTFPRSEAERLESHMPPSPATTTTTKAGLPFVTLTFATSMDSALSLGPGIRTTLSGPESKAMTHYLRSRHDAICVGVGTAIADDPGLNCRLAASHYYRPPGRSSSGDGDGGGHQPSATTTTPAASPPSSTPAAAAAAESAHQAAAAAATADVDTITRYQPRPVVIDPKLRWDFTRDSKVLQLARTGMGLAPFIITTARDIPAGKRAILDEAGGKFIVLSPSSAAAGEGEGQGQGAEGGGDLSLSWGDILSAVGREGLRSVMVEGGAGVINSLLSPGNLGLVGSVIVTLAPTWLGRGSVVVSPPQGGRDPATGQPLPAARLAPGATWIPLGEDVVLCGRIAKS